MVDEEIKLYASHHQFYFQDSEPRSTADDPTFWTEAAYAMRLAIGDGILGIGTGTYNFVKVRVEQHEAEPEIDLTQWDHVTECSLRVQSTFILIMGCLSRSGLFFAVEPGSFIVRACHANLAESEQEVPSEWKGDFKDWYLMQFWPGTRMETRVLKQR